jgi:hypothetical protein
MTEPETDSQGRVGGGAGRGGRVGGDEVKREERWAGLGGATARERNRKR